VFGKFKNENLDGDYSLDIPPLFLHYQCQVPPQYQVAATKGKASISPTLFAKILTIFSFGENSIR
jgi:hypothetical protein